MDDPRPFLCPSPRATEQHTPEGVDRTLIQWMLSLTPADRLAVLQQFADQAAELRRAGRPIR